MILIDDIFYNILLHCDIKTIYQFNKTKKNVNKITNKHFWKIKYHQDYLIIPKSLNYKKEYKKVHHYYKKSERLTRKLLTNERRYKTYDDYNTNFLAFIIDLPYLIDYKCVYLPIMLYNKIDNYRHVLAKYGKLKIYTHPYLFLSLYLDNYKNINYTIGYSFDHLEDGLKIKYNVNKYIFITFLTSIFYKYPTFKINYF